MWVQVLRQVHKSPLFGTFMHLHKVHKIKGKKGKRTEGKVEIQYTDAKRGSPSHGSGSQQVLSYFVVQQLLYKTINAVKALDKIK